MLEDGLRGRPRIAIAQRFEDVRVQLVQPLEAGRPQPLQGCIAGHVIFRDPPPKFLRTPKTPLVWYFSSD